MIKISKAELKDKILGAWVGKSYGAMMGEPMEFHAQGEIYEGSLEIQPEAPTTWLYYEDDLYTNMAFLEVMQEKGLQASQDDFAAVFRKSDFMLWHANGQARQNLLEGVPPGLSGHPYYNPHADDIDFQIECDFIGIISPGLSEAALEIADKVGHLMNYGDGYYAGAFLSALYAYAYVETDMVKMIQLALKAIPAKSDYAKIINDILGWYAEDPNDWRAAWQKVEEKWNRDLCPWAKSDPLPLKKDVLTDSFNIQGHFNGAYILLGLLYGKGDYLQAIRICTRCGQDTDSNVANCGGIMGVMLGNDQLPETVHAELAPYMDRDYHFTTLSINSATELSYKLALENIETNGGTITEKDVTLSVQKAVHSGPCEVSFPGFSFADIYTITPEQSPELKWHGDWTHPLVANKQGATIDDRQEQRIDRDFLSSAHPGDYLEVPFRGTCIYVQGNLHENCGILEAYVDGELRQTRDMHIRKIWNGHKQATAVWITGLTDEEHLLRVVVTGRKNPAATGVEIQLGRVVSYRGEIPIPQTSMTVDRDLNYHLAHPGGDSLPGDPNAAFYLDGVYHLHYILKHPFEGKDSYSFIHVTSPDMLHWTWQTTKLQPSFTGHGMFSGTGFITKEGKPAVIYHGEASGYNQIAIAKDNQLSAWDKPYPLEVKNVDSSLAEIKFWDPDCFLIDDTYYAISGGVTPLLMKSKDLQEWWLVGDFMAHDLEDTVLGEDISCANFFPLGDKWMLLCISHSLGCRYYIGDWDADAEHFVPQQHGRMNWRREDQGLYGLFNTTDFFAPESVRTPDGRRVMWAWCTQVNEAAGKSNLQSIQSLPRELSLPADGVVRMKPLEELASLRFDPLTLRDIEIDEISSSVLAQGGASRKKVAELSGDAVELRITIARAQAERKLLGFVLFADDSGDGLPIVLRPDSGTLRVGTTEAPFSVASLTPDEDLELRIFIDKYIVEVFANDRQALFTTHLDYRGKSGVAAFSVGAPTTIKTFEMWQIKPTNQGFFEARNNPIWKPDERVAPT